MLPPFKFLSPIFRDSAVRLPFLSSEDTTASRPHRLEKGSIRPLKIKKGDHNA